MAKELSLAVLFFLTPWAVGGSTSLEVSVLGANPTRVHLVGRGRTSSFVVSVENHADVTEDFRLILRPTAGWKAEVHKADRFFRPVGNGWESFSSKVTAHGVTRFVVLVRAGNELMDGMETEIVLTVVKAGSPPHERRLPVRVDDRPKIYYVALDGCGAGYLSLNRLGRPFDGSVERLMPRVNEFNQDAAYFPNARAHLPTATDPDHLAALTGSWPGTLGIYSVNHFYAGPSSEGEAVLLDGDKDLLRWGPEGTAVRTIFDILKDPDAGGSADVFSAFLSGKEWVGNLLRDDVGTVDIIAGAVEHPNYLTPPRRSRIGDPRGDPDPLKDREGTNGGPPWLQKRFSLAASYVNRHPEQFPDDDWIGEAAARIIAVEDPDVFYVLLADSDTGQHLFGAADHPEEWQDAGTPGILWDDTSLIDPRANRDPVLDIVSAADRAFGVLLDTLRARGTFDDSLVVLLADHGLTTTSPGPLDLTQIIASSGIAAEAIERVISAGQLGFVFLSEEAVAADVESALESHEETDPLSGELVRPFIVVNRDEMDSGVDGIVGPIAADGALGNKRGELYSEWNIDLAVEDNEKVRWPDLMIFNRSHFQNVATSGDNLGGTIPLTLTIGHHGSIQTSRIPLAIRGPGVLPGIYERHITLADVADTLYEILGLDKPEHVDGLVVREIVEKE